MHVSGSSPQASGPGSGQWSPQGTRLRGLTRYCPAELFLGTQNLIYSRQRLTLERLANTQTNRKLRVTRKHTGCMGRTACPSHFCGTRCRKPRSRAWPPGCSGSRAWARAPGLAPCTRTLRRVALTLKPGTKGGAGRLWTRRPGPRVLTGVIPGDLNVKNVSLQMLFHQLKC